MVQSLVCHQLAIVEMVEKKWIYTKKEVHSHKRLNIGRAKLSQLTDIKYKMLKWLRQLQLLICKQKFESIFVY